MKPTMTRGELRVIADTDHVQCGDAAARANMLLAGMDSEPVYQLSESWNGQPFSGWKDCTKEEFYAATPCGCVLMRRVLYAAPPAPGAVPDFGALTKIIVQRLVDCGAADDDGIAAAEEFVYNACRAAMLKAGPVTAAAMTLDYVQGENDGREWAAKLAEANHPQTGDWLYDDPIELAKAIRKGPDMPLPAAPDNDL